MPHYFFDIHDGSHVIDDMGQSLLNLRAVEAEAMRIAGSYAADPKMLGEGGGVIVVVARDASDATVLTARLVFNITLTPDSDDRRDTLA